LEADIPAGQSEHFQEVPKVCYSRVAAFHSHIIDLRLLAHSRNSLLPVLGAIFIFLARNEKGLFFPEKQAF